MQITHRRHTVLNASASDVPHSRVVSCTSRVPDGTHPPRQLEELMFHCYTTDMDTVLAQGHVLLRTAPRASERTRDCSLPFEFLLFEDLTKSPGKHKPAAPPKKCCRGGGDDMTSPGKFLQSWIQHASGHPASEEMDGSWRELWVWMGKANRGRGWIRLFQPLAAE